MRTFYFFTLVFMFVSASCGNADPSPLLWDLSIDNQLRRVNWPKDFNGELWYVDGPGTIRIKVRGDIEQDIPFWFAQVAREGGRIRTIRIMLPPGTVEQTYAAATKLANDWDFPNRNGIEDFMKNRGERILRGGGSQGSVLADNTKQPRMIEIRQSFAGPDKPWYALLAMGFIPDFDAPPSTTQATTRPTSK